MKTFRRLTMATLAMVAVALAPASRAQLPTDTLTQAEIDQVRDARQDASECVLLFVKFLDLRTREITNLFAKPRGPGREQDTHDLLEQFTAIADELSDNLDDYGPRHADLRKALPKVLEAVDRWSSSLKSPPQDEAYNVSRKIALESIRDLRESATELVADQAAWFKAHPPDKKQPAGVAPPIDIRR